MFEAALFWLQISNRLLWNHFYFKLYAQCLQIEYCECIFQRKCVSQHLCAFYRYVSVCESFWIRKPSLSLFQYFYYSLRPYGTNYKQNICREGQKPYFYELLQHLVADLMPQLLYNKAKTLTEVKEPANHTILCKSWQSPAKLHGRAGLKNEETFKFTDLMRPQMINELRSDSWMTERSAESFFPIQKGF